MPRPTRRRLAMLVVFVLGPLLLVAIAIVHISQGESSIPFRTVVSALVSPDGSTADLVVRHLRLPRTVAGILTGGALAMSGTLLQTVTRNPLASSSTLGVSAGAYFALVIAAVFAPGMLGLSPMAVAFLGAMVATGLAFAIAGSSGLTPVRLALAGVAVALVFSALTGMLQLLYENETSGLFLWGAGSLAQSGWGGVTYVAPRIAVGVVVAMLLARQMDTLLLGDDVATSLGQRVMRVRIAGLLTGVFLAATAVSLVGPIGFVGLVVPHLVRLIGLTGHRLLLPGAAIWGAVMLLGADMFARLVTSTVNELPAGSVTALIGAPFFVWLARRQAGSVDSARGSGSTVRGRSSSKHIPYPVLTVLLVVILLLTIAAGVMVGDLRVSPGELLATLQGTSTPLLHKVLLDLRLPRLLVAALAGAALATSGTVLQGVVRNPLAGPEIVGVTSGAGLGALLMIVLFPSLPFIAVPISAMLGGIAAFGVVYITSWRGGISPTRLALVGIAMSAFCSAGINLLVVRAQFRVAQALVWLSGSTYARGWDDLVRLLPWCVVLLPMAWLAARELDILAFGDDVAKGLGLRLERWRLGLLAVAVALAAAAVSVVGTISFVGLVGPHAARLLSPVASHRRLLPVAAMLGAILVVFADTLGRFALAPKEIPSGLVTALIGAPYFLWLLWRQRAR